MNDKLNKLMQNRVFTWVITCIMFIISGYSFFPLVNMDLYIVYIFMVIYWINTSCLIRLLYKKAILFYFLSLFLTIIGMSIRFIIEYGEVSHKINFTKFNIITFPILVTGYCLCIYYYYLYKRKEKDK